MTLWLAARPNARLVSTRSRIRVATARLMHAAQNCRRPFACAIPNARALAALGLSSFKIFNYLNERIPLDQFANEVARVWRMPCRTAPGPAIGAEGSAGRT